MNSLSPDLRFELAGLLGRLLTGQINTPESLAQACDKIFDLAWAEAEVDDEELTPPSMEFNG